MNKKYPLILVILLIIPVIFLYMKYPFVFEKHIQECMKRYI